MEDNVNSPKHYTTYSIEVIDFIEEVAACYTGRNAYCIGNVIKYVTRAPHKGSMLEDLQKARWYLDKAISKLETE